AGVGQRGDGRAREAAGPPRHRRAARALHGGDGGGARVGGAPAARDPGVFSGARRQRQRAAQRAERAETRRPTRNSASVTSSTSANTAASLALSRPRAPAQA